ncbi:MAG: multicomponent Na+:H+ antiporter subunit, partial [Streptomyces sp.]|nr:multicomponent Na+:H+ antiporter subunit [Streptomyces sp.]
FNTLSSGGLVPVINAAVGVEVASGVIVLLACFLDQTIATTGPDEAGRSNASDTSEGTA